MRIGASRNQLRPSGIDVCSSETVRFSCGACSFLVKTATTLRVAAIKFFSWYDSCSSAIANAIPHAHLASGWSLGGDKQSRERASNQRFIHV